MKIATALFTIFTSITLVTQVPLVAQRTAPTFRAGVELTVVLVNVTDRDSKPVSTLTRNDFVLLENGTPQPLAHFLSAAGAVDVALLVDMSGSIAPALTDLRRTAGDFVEALRPNDRVMLVGFDQKVRPLSDLTDDRLVLEKAVDRVRPGGSTSLFDSIYISLNTLATTSSPDFTRRMAVVVITDGDDTSSNLLPQEVREQSRRFGIPIYMILINQSIEEMRDRFGSYEHKQRRFEMKALGQETGGRTLVVAEGRSFKDAFRSIVADLSQQYVLAYERSRGQGNPQINVRIPSRPSVVVKTHVGHEQMRTGG